METVSVMIGIEGLRYPVLSAEKVIVPAQGRLPLKVILKYGADAQ